MKETPTRKFLKEAMSLVLKIMVIAVIGFCVWLFLLVPYRVTSNAMFPMVKSGDLCLVYRREKAFTNDLVLYKENGTYHIGRVIAISGQEVEYHENGFTVNGYEPAEEIFYPTQPKNPDEYDVSHIVSENSIYVLNDHREELTDSRSYGDIPKQNVIGKVIFILRRRSF